MPIDPTTLTIKKAVKGLKQGDFTAVELAEGYIDRIKKRNKDVNAFLEVYDDVIDQAKAAQKRIESGEAGSLTGIPCGIKDNILIKGRVSSAASKMLEKYTATYDSTVGAKLKSEGAVFIGRTNMDEFAMGSSTENSAFGPTKNPYDTTRVAGGSSGGSAAAVAMGGAMFALGSDTGGSIRQPASLCGVVGLKPTYGAVSRYGLMAMGSSLDQIGPIAKSVSDCEIVFNAIKGEDREIHGGRGDATAIKDDTYPRTRNSDGKSGNKMTIGVPRHFLTGEGIDPAVLDSFNLAIKSLEGHGYKVKEITLPNISYSLPVYYVIMPAEVSSNMARYDGVRFGLHKKGKNMVDDYFESRHAGFGREVVRRIILGTYVLSSGYYDAYYNRANAVRRMITEDFEKAFKEVDIIATPTTPSPAFKLGEKTNDPVAMYLEDIFTVTANLTGMPAISLPCGTAVRTDAKGNPVPLPLGLQLTARHGAEDDLFTAGKDFLGESEA